MNRVERRNHIRQSQGPRPWKEHGLVGSGRLLSPVGFGVLSPIGHGRSGPSSSPNSGPRAEGVGVNAIPAILAILGPTDRRSLEAEVTAAPAVTCGNASEISACREPIAELRGGGDTLAEG